MTYDPNVPEELKEVQAWFSGVITQPIDQESHINPISPTGKPIEQEAKKYIAPSPTLRSHERIQIYNQQYWWRLLNTLQDTFPLATRLLGYKRFNQTIATPYIEAYPSEHWSLIHLGERLFLWIEEFYEGEEKQLLLDAVRVDEAFNESFFAAHYPSIGQNKSPEMAMVTLAILQPHIFLFELNYDLFRFRKEIKQKDPDFWSNHHFPSLKHALSENAHHFPELKKGEYYFIIYRSKSDQLLWDDLSKTEYFLLKQFKEGTTIQQCCELLEQGDPALLEEAKEHLKEWIEKWMVNEWLYPTSI